MGISNEEKHELYSLWKTKMKIAIQQEFYLEALMIEYSIMEDRLNSVLHRVGIPTTRKDGRDKGINEKLKDIQKEVDNKQFPIYRRITTEQITDIVEWKNKRNDLVHKRFEIAYNSDEVRDCALTGEKLVNLAINFARNVQRAIARKDK